MLSPIVSSTLHQSQNFSSLTRARVKLGMAVKDAAIPISLPTSPAEIRVGCEGLEIATQGSVDPSETPLVAVIGCGYVGTHLIRAFSVHYDVLGFDVSEKRLDDLRQEFKTDGISATLTTYPQELAQATHILVSVPTLVLKDKSIDTSYIRDALNNVARYARSGSTIVIESSVAVGMTRQLLGPLAKERGFFAGMSPEVSRNLLDQFDFDMY